MRELKKEIEDLIKKVNQGVKIKAKEASIKLGIGKQSMSDENIIEKGQS